MGGAQKKNRSTRPELFNNCTEGITSSPTTCRVVTVGGIFIYAPDKIIYILLYGYFLLYVKDGEEKNTVF